MRAFVAAALAASLATPAARAATWSFQAPLGGFDLGAAQRGLGLYEQRCAACHAMAAMSPADLEALGFDRRTVVGTLRALGHPPFTGGSGAPDLSRFELVRGPDALAALLLAGAGDPPYNGVPPGHPVLASRGEVRDLVTFLAWAAHPHQTARRQLGVAVLLFGLLLIGLGARTARRRRHG